MDDKITYSIESSFDFEDKEKAFDEYWVIVADGGEEFGTCTCATFNIKTSKEELEAFIKFIESPTF